MQRGILKRLAELEAKVEVPRLDLDKISDSDLERLEVFFLRVAEAEASATDFGALPRRLQKLVVKSMEIC